MKSQLVSSLLGLTTLPRVAAASWSHIYVESPRGLSQSFHLIRARADTASIKNTTSIAKSWDGATLLNIEGQVTSATTGGVQVICQTCYVEGLVTTELNYVKGFNLDEAIGNFTSDVFDDIDNITTAAANEVEMVLKEAVDDLTTLNFDGLAHIDFPPLNASFNVDFPAIPHADLRFQLDGMELYAMLDTTLSAGTSYTLNLYNSETPVGLALDGSFIGVVASMDLILSTDGEINMSSGIHLKANDGLALDISLFGRSVSGVTFNGGSFEFLPVKITNSTGVLTATLRLGLHAGASIALGKEILPEFPLLTAHTGAEVLVYADLAEFTTNITTVGDGDDSGCGAWVQQGYQLALGAAAGATLVVAAETWGPNPTTKIPIYYTTLADVCAESVTPTAIANATSPAPTSDASVAARATGDMVTTTITTEATFTGVVCGVTGVAACPASKQSTTKVVSTLTLVTIVPSGSEATFPATTQTTVMEKIPFTSNVKSVPAMSGSPVSYVPPPPPPTTSASGATPSSSSSVVDGIGDEIKKARANKPLIIGLTVGLGVPFLAGVIAAIYFLIRRKKYAPVSMLDRSEVTSPQDYRDDILKKPQITVMTTIKSNRST